MLLLTALVAGAIPEASAPPPSGTGPFDVPPERIATAAKIQGSAAFATGIPLGAAAWEQPFDPGDIRPFGFSFVDVLDDGDTIASIDRLAMSSQAATLGVIIDDSSGRAPIVDQDDQRRIQLWFAVSSGQQEGPSFDADGVRLRVTFRVLTTKGQRIERTGVLTVRQL